MVDAFFRPMVSVRGCAQILRDRIRLTVDSMAGDFPGFVRCVCLGFERGRVVWGCGDDGDV